MIRREDGADWLLIPQIEHAHVAAEIAAAWGRALSPDVVAAVRHHDDGWREWDASPRIDPETGIPRSFLEMPMSVATEIWSRSIELCGQERKPQSEVDQTSSPLGGLAVSGHFCWLAEQACESRDDPEELAAIERFLEAQARQQTAWREALQRQENASTADVDLQVELGFRTVQFFDRLSLWLCCAVQSKPYEAEFPGGGIFKFAPLAPETVSVEPDPFLQGAGPATVTVVAKRIAARSYADDDDLLNALHDSPAERLTWTLLPA
jgi:hypothetical protein